MESVVVLSHSVIDGAAWRLDKRKALQFSEKRVHVDRPDRSEGDGLRGPPWRADAQRTLDEGWSELHKPSSTSVDLIISSELRERTKSRVEATDHVNIQLEKPRMGRKWETRKRGQILLVSLL